MTKVYARTENGITTHVDIETGRSEINTAMMEGKRNVREMSQITRTDFSIGYRDGRSVRLVLVETDRDGRRIVTAKGKRYVVSSVVPAQTERRQISERSYSLPHPAYVTYWSAGPTGSPFGPTRNCSSRSKPGTVGHAIWDAIQ